MRGLVATLAILGIFAGAPTVVGAQEMPPITLDLKDAPIRATLEAVFKQAGIKNYVIENDVVGFVTMTITDQPFDNALKLVMRASSVPLTFAKEGDVYIVKARRILANQPAALVEPTIVEAPATPRYERINLTHVDPVDLSGILGGIIEVRHFTRQGNGSNNNRGQQGMQGRNGMPGGLGGMQGGFGSPMIGMQGGFGVGNFGPGMGNIGVGSPLGGMQGGFGSNGGR